MDLEDGDHGRTRTAMKKKRQGRGDGDGNRVKKGFSDEQVRMLETMFETETRPEQRMKVDLARELGLQPRQVATWFQNRRARWKSKQLEREYGSMKCNYDKLSLEYESLKKEKQRLRSEMQRLSCMLGRTGDRTTTGEEDPVGTFCRQLHEGTIKDSVDDTCELLQKAGGEDDGGALTETQEKWCGFGSTETTSEYHSCTGSSAEQWWNFYN